MPSHSIMCSSGRLPFSLMPMRSWTTWPMTWTESESAGIGDIGYCIRLATVYDAMTGLLQLWFQLEAMIWIDMLWYPTMLYASMNLCATGDALDDFGLDSQKLTQEQVTDELPQCHRTSWMCTSSGSIWSIWSIWFLNNSKIIGSIYPNGQAACWPASCLSCAWASMSNMPLRGRMVQRMIKTQLFHEPCPQARRQTLFHAQIIINNN